MPATVAEEHDSGGMPQGRRRGPERVTPPPRDLQDEKRKWTEFKAFVGENPLPAAATEALIRHATYGPYDPTRREGKGDVDWRHTQAVSNEWTALQRTTREEARDEYIRQNSARYGKQHPRPPLDAAAKWKMLAIQTPLVDKRGWQRSRETRKFDPSFVAQKPS